MDLSGLVVREGGRARASGRVLVVDGDVWFELPLAEVAIYPPPTPRPSRWAVRAFGVDLNRLDQPETRDGVRLGWATLTGTWRDHQLHVTEQTPWQPPAHRSRWTTPPCPPPPGGWPHGNPGQPPDREEQAELTITQLTMFHPSRTQPVLVIAAEDVDRAEQALRPRFGAALCVVPSRWSQRQIDEVGDRLHVAGLAGEWPMSMWGLGGASPEGQPQLSAQLAWLVPGFVEWATTVPDGLLDVDVWLVPEEQLEF